MKDNYNTDLIGRKFGYLEVLYKDTEKTKQGKSKWVCKCNACGNIISIARPKLISGDATSCGCMFHAVKEKNDLDLTGETFGSLKVQEKISGKGVNTLWKCQCNCGNVINVIQSNLTSGATNSCGCMHRKQSSENIKDYMGIIDGTNASIISSNKIPSNNTTGIKGVYYVKRLNKWNARIMFKGKSYNLGYYAKKEDAIRARKEGELEIHGPFLEWYNSRNVDKTKLTDKQRKVYDLYNSGMIQVEIAKELGCSRQNVSRMLKSIRECKNGEKRKRGGGSGKAPRNPLVDYNKYLGMDLSELSDRQRKALVLRMEGKTCKEIAEILNISRRAADSLLQTARMKCDGKWEEHEKKVRERNKVYNSENREQKTLAAREYREKNRDKYKRYQQEYYKKNKEKIVAKRKEKEDGRMNDSQKSRE